MHMSTRGAKTQIPALGRKRQAERLGIAGGYVNYQPNVTPLPRSPFKSTPQLTLPSGSISLSERPLTCFDIHPSGKSITLGSADHALYTLSLPTLKLTQTLYTKKSGHTEWVTCCAALPSDRVLSGGMDSKLFLWDARTPISRQLIGHEASITSVKADEGEKIAISSSYDGTIRAHELDSGTQMGLWGGDFDGKIANGDYMAATRNPILEFVWDSGDVTGSTSPSSRLIACTREGRLLVFDMNATTSAPYTVVRAHRGPVRHALIGSHPSLLISAGNLDGAVRMFDLRLPPEKGRGVRKLENLHDGGVTNLVACGRNTLVTSGGADGTLKILESASLQVQDTLHSRPDTSVGSPAASAYALAPFEDGILSSWGDGRLTAHNLKTKEVIADLNGRNVGINNALKKVVITDNEVIIGAGDDGIAVIWRK